MDSSGLEKCGISNAEFLVKSIKKKLDMACTWKAQEIVPGGGGGGGFCASTQSHYSRECKSQK